MKQSFRWFLAVVLLGACANHAGAQFPAGNPLNATIPKTPWTVELEDVLTIPNSSGLAPRVEFLTSGGAPGLAYVIDQRGPIYTFDPTDTNPTPALFLDIATAAPNFFDGFQRGVRGLAFHPDFNNPGTAGFRKFYTSHSRTAFSGPPVGNPTIFFSPISPNHDSVVAEWAVNPDGTVNTGAYRELMYVGQPRDDHNVGQIGFNPNAMPGDADYGNLYIALGDGGGVHDPDNLAQNIGIMPPGNPTGYPHGSILRIDPIASGGDPYTIPGDNPFVGQANTIEEVWAYGFRNPHRFSWDAITGKMLISDIGQTNIEEINLGAPGANYGWDPREGTFQSTANDNVVRSLPGNHPTDGFTYPVAQYDHDPDNNNSIQGLWAVVGGSVYRGTDVPELTGMYLFGDFAENHGPIFAVGVNELVQRDDFSNLSQLDDGLLAPIVELTLTQNGQERTLLEIIRAASGNPSLNRTDLRFGVGPDNEIYVLNKRDGVVRRIASVSGLLRCDFDHDGTCGIDDIDALVMEIVAMSDDSRFDLNADGSVDLDDRDAWLADAGAENLPSEAPYLVSDFNLDGTVDGQDFIIWNANKFSTTGKWSLGDANADGVTDGQDFILWNINKFMSSDGISAVPEPAAGLFVLVAVVLTAAISRKSRVV